MRGWGGIEISEIQDPETAKLQWRTGTYNRRVSKALCT